ncbi:MAG: glycosyltransferase [Casimicrobiaceae bacterium]
MSFTGRVLHICKYWAPFHGGVERFVEDLVREQRRQGIEAFALAHHPPGFPLPNDDPPWLRRVPVVRELAFVPLAPRLRAELARAIADFRPDYLHWHMPNMAPLFGFLLGSARRLPWVLHWHSDVVASRHQRVLRWLYPLYRPYERAVLDAADLIITTSASYLITSEALAAHRERCVAIPLGLRQVDRQPTEAERAWAARQWPPGSVRLLAIGRLTYYKGFDTLISALHGLPEVALVLVGTGQEASRLDQLIHRLGLAARVRRIERVTEYEKIALLQSAQAFALPSRERTEAFGLVLLEAMREGCPLLASHLEGSGVLLLARHLDNALLAPPEDIPAWRAAIARLAGSPELRQRLGARGLERAQFEFDLPQVTRRIIDTVGAVLDPDHPRHEPHRRPLVVIPARDEVATIGEVVAAARARGFTDVLVVDDASSDGTGRLAQQAGARVLRTNHPLGAWGATQCGIRFALRHDYTAVLTMDADGQHLAQELDRLLDQGGAADVIIGACPARGSALRRLAWAWFRLLTGQPVEDFTSGFRLYSRRAMEALASNAATQLDYQDVGVLDLLARHGLTAIELPVAMLPRKVGRSHIFANWFIVARYMLETTLIALARRGHRIRRLPAPGAWQ